MGVLTDGTVWSTAVTISSGSTASGAIATGNATFLGFEITSTASDTGTHTQLLLSGAASSSGTFRLIQSSTGGSAALAGYDNGVMISPTNALMIQIAPYPFLALNTTVGASTNGVAVTVHMKA
jgi:hypothetical protein